MSDSNGGWDDFDGNTWGTDAANGATPRDAGNDDAAERNGMNGMNGMNGHVPSPGEDEDAVPAEGQWVSSGGVLHWEEPDDAASDRVNLRAEAESRWADDNVDLPLGAPSRLRVRALRAWLARQRLLEQEAQGAILLERRQLHEESGEEEPRPGDEFDPLNLALAERQAAASEYERMLEALADLESHSGLDRVLVEFYLWLGERIGTLALAPEAPDDFRAAALVATPDTPQKRAAPTPLSLAEWRGQAEAALMARRHAERVSAPEEDE